jgi:hypothetical protein
MAEEAKPPMAATAVGSHPPPIPMRNAPKRDKTHRQHVKRRAPFLPKDHVSAKHRLRGS